MQMPQISRGRALAYLAAVLVVLAVGGKVLLGADSSPRAGGGLDVTGASSSAFVAEPAPPVRLVVDVVGAVRRPGLYELPDGSRVDDAIRKAGGAKPTAALAQINLAAPLADGAQIVVPVRARAGSPTAEPAPDAAPVTPPSGAATPATPVHLNTATLEELDGLPGVGPVTAQRILDYRQEHGAFRSVDELDAVPGIGPARLEQLRELVQL
jgi:competence protein ComEA